MDELLNEGDAFEKHLKQNTPSLVSHYLHLAQGPHKVQGHSHTLDITLQVGLKERLKLGTKSWQNEHRFDAGTKEEGGEKKHFDPDPVAQQKPKTGKTVKKKVFFYCNLALYTYFFVILYVNLTIDPMSLRSMQ